MFVVNWGMLGGMILPNIGGWLGAIVVSKNINPWYESLNKPNWRPPNWAFGPVWTLLYTSMGYASHLVYSNANGFHGDGRIPLLLYGSQLILNWLWTPIFFGLRKPGLAFAEIVVLYANAGLCGLAFWKINWVAGSMMIPYMGWLTLATALNWYIWKNNPTKTD